MLRERSEAWRLGSCHDGGPAVPAPRPARLNLDATVRAALDAQDTLAAGGPPRPSTRRFWFGTLVSLLVVIAVVAWFGAGRLQRALEIGASGPAEPRRPTLGEAHRAALVDAINGLRQLQAASTPNLAYSVYASRVMFAKADVDRYLTASAPAETKDRVREVLDLHLLASAAWKARSLNAREAWESVGQDPALDLCPAARRIVDFAEQPASQSRAHTRGVAIASAIPLLWECAAERIGALERGLTGT